MRIVIPLVALAICVITAAVALAIGYALEVGIK